MHYIKEFKNSAAMNRFLRANDRDIICEKIDLLSTNKKSYRVKYRILKPLFK